jgi:aminoglycoside phosphotransferase (APT) family kinase protein
MPWPTHDPSIIKDFARAFCANRGWTLLDCSPWREGASNAIWTLDANEGKFVLKVGKLEQWRRLSAEASVLEALDGRDAPRLIDHGVASPVFPWDWSVLERVIGRHIHSLDPSEALELGALISRARTNAALLDLETGSWRVFLEKRITGSVGNAARAMPGPLAEKFEGLIGEARRLGKWGDLLDSLPAGISHGDVIPLNLVKMDSGGFSLLDWENPRNASTAWDIACVRKSFKLGAESFRALRLGIGDEVPDEAISFADALYQLQVAAWRAETWYGRNLRREGEFFLVELGEELGRVELLLRSLDRRAIS